MSIFTPRYEKITIFAFHGKDGAWRLSKGQVSDRLISAVAGACADERVSDGWIAYKEEDGRRWVDFSPSFSVPARSRIQTIIFGMVM